MKLLPSPLIHEDGSLVPCSCQVAKVCEQAGGQTECSSYWYLAPTSVAAKFNVRRAPDGHISEKVKEPGSLVTAGTIHASARSCRARN